MASLNALDDEETEKYTKPYQPSFLNSNQNSATPGATARHEDSTHMFSFDPVTDNPFNSSTFKSLDSSINSVKSTMSVDSEKKAKLMRELFTTN